MKYLGKKSLSSVLHQLFRLGWFVAIGTWILGLSVLSFLLFSEPPHDPAMTELDTVKIKIAAEMKKEDPEAWEEIRSLPTPAKAIIPFYFSVMMILLLLSIGKGERVFRNFKNNVIFDETNIVLIGGISKLLIVYSIITFGFSSFIASVILLVLNDVFKNGTALQEEHDLTV